MSSPTLLPERTQSDTYDGRWMVVIYNNDHTTIHEVISILMSATGCDFQEAELETMEAHVCGKAPVHFAAREECEEAAVVIASVGVRTEVAPEWKD